MRAGFRTRLAGTLALPKGFPADPTRWATEPVRLTPGTAESPLDGRRPADSPDGPDRPVARRPAAPGGRSSAPHGASRQVFGGRFGLMGDGVRANTRAQLLGVGRDRFGARDAEGDRIGPSTAPRRIGRESPRQGEPPGETAPRRRSGVGSPFRIPIPIIVARYSVIEILDWVYVTGVPAEGVPPAVGMWDGSLGHFHATPDWYPLPCIRI
jgi:hypothetical protein